MDGWYIEGPEEPAAFKDLDTSLIEPRHSRRKSRRNTPIVGD
jgi:hypothetical protein